MHAAQQFRARRVAEEDRRAVRVQLRDELRIVLERDVRDALGREQLGQLLPDAAEAGPSDFTF